MENDNEEGLKEEDNVEDDQHDLEHHVPDVDDEELVESDDVADSVHEDYIVEDLMIENDINDDDDMANPYNVKSRSDDTYDDLDEEDDEVH